MVAKAAGLNGNRTSNDFRATIYPRIGGFSVSRDALFSFRNVRLAACLRAVAACWIVAALFFASNIQAAEYQTANFIIRNAPNLEMARQFGQTAEQYRKDLAILWLGEELPPWASPCPISVKVGNFGAGGETSMRFDKTHLFEFEWDMKIQGPADAIMTAVLPHEITHVVLASHLKAPIPRWIDEGAATFVENEKERQNYRRLLYQYLRTGRGIPFNQLFRMTQYPDDQMPLYSQSFALAEFLILQQGHRHYVDFAASGMKTGDWAQAIFEFYGYENLGELQVKWTRWVGAGCPDWTQIPVDQPIFVRESTQYIALQDFMPTRQPLILARATRTDNIAATDSRIVPVSWESPLVASGANSEIVTAAGLEAALPPQREPLRLAVSQPNPNPPLTATLAPISESGKMLPYTTSHDATGYAHQSIAPQAIAAQPMPIQALSPQPVAVQPLARPATVAPTRMQDSASHWAAMATNDVKRTNPQPQPEQRFYQTPQNTQSTETLKDSRIIMDWRIR